MSERLVFVDRNISGYAGLIAALPSDIDCFLLDSDRDGVEQIADVLASHSGLRSVHVVSHGGEGSLMLGNTRLDAVALSRYDHELDVIGHSLAAGGDILLYGCQVGAGDEGQSFLQQLADKTGANIAASNDLTAPDGLGGNVNLEVHVGTVEAQTLALSGLNAALDAITGTSGNDILNGTAGDDYIDGLGGVDMLSFSAVSQSITADLSNGVVFGQGTDKLTGVENLLGGKGDDVLKGDANNNTLYGENGADMLSGAGGSDYLYGGMGNDILDGGADSDTLSGGPGDDLLSGGDGFDVVDFGGNSLPISADLSLGKATGDGSDTLVSIEALYGGKGDDTLVGDANSNELKGNSGNDKLSGGGGWDNLWGQAGNDVLDGGDGVDSAFFLGLDGVAVNANLATGTATGDGTDKLISIENLYSYAASADVLTGNASANRLYAGEGNDTLIGGDGDDYLIGGGGNDSLNGGTGNDTVEFSWDSAVNASLLTGVATGDGSDTLIGVENLYGGKGNDVFTGDAQANRLMGNSGDDSLYGGGGNDYLSGGMGNNYLDGGAGIDTAAFNIGAVSASLIAGNATDRSNGTVIATLVAIENLEGGPGDDLLYGDGNVNQLIGGKGDDWLDGGGGADQLMGGLGSDSYMLDVATDVITENPNEGNDAAYINFSAAGTYTLPTNVETGYILSSPTLAINLTGNALDNTLYGSGGANTLSGGAGNDSLKPFAINSSSAYDVVDGGVGDDTLVVMGAFGDYTVSRVNATDTNLVNSSTGERITLRGIEKVMFEVGNQLKTMGEVWGNLPSGYDDQLTGTAGNDTIDGLAGNDMISGLDGDDRLIGGTGSDNLFGGNGNDTYVVDVATDVITEYANQGTDLVEVAFTAAGTYVLSANVEGGRVTAGPAIAANLTGNDLDNHLYGNAASNVLLGGKGNDYLDGGAGADQLKGGAGNDTYALDVSTDVITENANEGYDTAYINFSAAGSYTLPANVEAADSYGFATTPAISLIGNALDNMLRGNDGVNTLSGGAGNDLLIPLGCNSSTAYDVVDGGAGDDTLMLGTFGDYVVNRINATDTTLISSSTGERILLRGIEKIYFDDGNQLKTMGEVWGNVATAYDDQLTGTAGNDSIDGLAGNDLISGLDGDDRLIGGSGSDTLLGGSGNDTYVVDVATDVISENANAGNDLVEVAFTAAGTYVLSANVEAARVTAGPAIAVNLTGNELDNGLYGNAASNILLGGGGDDWLDGGAGADQLKGGVGDDSYVLDTSTDVITENVNEGNDWAYINFSGASTYTLPANLERATILPSSATIAISLTGNVSDNALFGNNGANTLSGGIGNDWLKPYAINSGTAYDVVDGGAGDDTLVVMGAFGDYAINRINATDTTLINSSTGERITLRGIEKVSFEVGNQLKTMADVWGNVATVYDDQLTGTAGNDTIDGLAGNDQISSFDGNDRLIGGSGSDSLFGGKGDDTYVVDVATDVITEYTNQGTDLVEVAFTAAGTYVLSANLEDASVTAAAAIAVNLTGNDLNNSLIGNAASNILLGGDGNDWLDGGAGADQLKGGTGNDQYVLDVGTDVITENTNEGNDWAYINFSIAGTYTLPANVEGAAIWSAPTLAINLTGNMSDNMLLGSGGANILSGGGGNDGLKPYAINSGTAYDVVDGGAGEDTLIVMGAFGDYAVNRINAADTTLINSSTGERITLRGIEWVQFESSGNQLQTMAEVWGNIATAYDDQLSGTAGNDTIDGLAGNDLISGFDGNDRLIGGSGSDSLFGGKGDDTYVVDVATDAITEYANQGYDRVEAAFTAAGTYVLSANLEDASVTAAAAIAVNLTGNDLDNRLYGNTASNTLLGGAGNDWLDGGTGADQLKGGAGNDGYVLDVSTDVITENANEGYDRAYLNFSVAGSYTLPANVEGATISNPATTLAINLTGNTLPNQLDGNDGVNNLSGGDGDDWLTAYGGADILSGGNGNDTLIGGSGADVMTGGAGADRYLIGNEGQSGATSTYTDKTGIGVNSGDLFDFTAVGGTDVVYWDQYDSLVVARGAFRGNLAGYVFDGIATGDVWFVRGKYVTSTQDFTVDTVAGTDTLVLWQDSVANTPESVVLIGTTSISDSQVAYYDYG